MALMLRKVCEGARVARPARAVLRKDPRRPMARLSHLGLLASFAAASLGGCASTNTALPAAGPSGASARGPMFPESKWGVSASRRVATAGTHIPKGGGHYKVGAPYQVGGRWYNPREQPDYDRIGVASWYGRDFHGRKTANGETYNQMDLTAAHPTLPMPVMVQVTNLENGRSIKVRVNDRGPFANGRIIDLSKRSAQLLGMEQKGTAKVLVEILREESLQLASIAQGKTPPADDEDVPAAAPVGQVESKPLGGSAGGPSPAPAPVPNPAPPSPTLASGPAVPWPDGQVQHKNVQPTQIYIQAGSFANPTNAETLRGRLAGFGTAFVAVAQVGGQNFYRVRVGPLASVEEADRVLNNLIASGHTESRVVVE